MAFKKKLGKIYRNGNYLTTHKGKKTFTVAMLDAQYNVCCVENSFNYESQVFEAENKTFSFFM